MKEVFKQLLQKIAQNTQLSLLFSYQAGKCGGIVIGLIDANSGKVLFDVGGNDWCNTYRNNIQQVENCILQQTEISCWVQNSSISCACHPDMVSRTHDIVVEKQVVGYILICNFFENDIKHTHGNYDLEESQLQEFYITTLRKVPVIKGDEIEEIAKVLAELVQLYSHMELELSQSNYRLSTAITDDISHKFNNILASIMGYTELVMDEVDRDSLEYGYLEEVIKASKRAKELFNQRVEKDKTPKVLVVEEEIVLAKIYEKLLNKKDISIQTCTDKQQAWKLFHYNPNEYSMAIISEPDNCLPDEDLYHKILELRPDLPMVIISRDDNSAITNRFYQSQEKNKYFIDKARVTKELVPVVSDLIKVTKTNRSQ